jgi:general secretion pathway protein N
VNGTVRLLILMAVALSGLIAIELFMSSGDNTDTAEAPAAQTAENAPAADAQSPADLAATVLARPLFRADRKPYATNDQDVSTAPIDLPRLAGILMASDLKRAIFAPDGSDKAIVVSEGESVGSWRVQEIAPDSVTMTGPDGTRRIRPKFAANAVPATPADVAAPMPEPAPAPAVGTGPLPQLPKRGAAALNARRRQHDNMRPPQPPRKH